MFLNIKQKVQKAREAITLLRMLPKYVDRNVRDLSYKMYARPHLDYGDVIYHLIGLIESIQYKAVLF